MKRKTDGSAAATRPVALPEFAQVKQDWVKSEMAGKPGNGANGKEEYRPLPDEIGELHRTAGPDSLSNSKFWGAQGQMNLAAVWRRLKEIGQEFTEELYNELFGYQELPEGWKDENLGVVRREGGAPIVLCLMTRTHKAEQTSQEIAARWMAWVDEKGNLVFKNPADGHDFVRVVDKKGKAIFLFWRNELVPKPVELVPDKDGNISYINRDNQDVVVAVDDLVFKRTGVYTTSISVNKDGSGKPVSINEKLTGVKIVCGPHQHIVKKKLRVPFLTILDAAVRLERIMADKQGYIDRGGARNEDLEEGFGQEAIRYAVRRAEGNKKDGKGDRRSWRK